MIELIGTQHKGCPCVIAAFLKNETIQFIEPGLLSVPNTEIQGQKAVFEYVCEKCGYLDAHSEAVEKAFEYQVREKENPLFKYTRTLLTLLGMGVRRSPIQMDIYNQVLEYSKEILEKFTELNDLLLKQKYIYGEEIGAVDIIYFGILSHIYLLCMLPEYQELYPALSTWYKNLYQLPIVQELYTKKASVFTLRHNVEIDLEPNPSVIAALADYSVELNKDATKALSQRDLEKAKKAQNAAATTTNTAAETITVSILPQENKIYTPEECMQVLKDMNIEFRLDHPPAQTVEDVLKYVDMSESIPTKNLFLKAKKPHENESGLYLVVASVHTNVDIKSLTSELKYKSGSLRFADAPTLDKYMHVKQGHLSLLSLLNEPTKKVHVILDKALMSNDFHKISLHPLTNEISLVISVEDAMKFLKACGHSYEEREF